MASTKEFTVNAVLNEIVSAPNHILHKVETDDGTRRVAFFCPGCGCGHAVIVEGDPLQVPVWDWNRSMIRPTFIPSIRVRATAGEEAKATICHSYVREGVIQFLIDSTHKLAGKTISLEPF